MSFSIAIHGGAGTILPEQMTPQLQQAIEAALEQALRSGYDILKLGGHAVDAVAIAVKVLEDCPHFNAGCGSVLTNNEMVEMDASIMDGNGKQAGAIAGVKHIRNPIELAKTVMKDSEHVFLIGDGAESFAFDQGFTYTEQDYFYTDRRYDQLISMKEKGLFALSESRYPDDNKYGTVGAVALDQHGNLAAATSTGGITNKKYGRVGDSAVIGAGTWAENGVVAVSTTGMGEYFLQESVASDLAARVRYLGETISQAGENIIQGRLKDRGGEGGLIAMDKNGHACFAMNSSGMYRGVIDLNGHLEIKIYADQE
ncbi:isoaspartyl peptidase/L-asparaginase [Vibrio sp. FNV 38]|nr:isoaspartyl peptidase/L-asparaginase [Vibrio sp. FNV 38]